MITDTDLVWETVGLGRDPRKVSVHEVMTPAPLCVVRDDTPVLQAVGQFHSSPPIPPSPRSRHLSS